MTFNLKAFLSPRNRSMKLFALAAGFVVVAGGLFHAARSNEPIPRTLLAAHDEVPRGAQMKSADAARLGDGPEESRAPRAISLTPPLPHPRPAVATIKSPKPAEPEVRGARKKPGSERADNERAASAPLVERGGGCTTGCATLEKRGGAPLPARTGGMPLQAVATPAQGLVRAEVATRPLSPPEPSVGETIVVGGRDVLAWIVATPGTTMTIGTSAISHVADAIR